MIEWAIVLLFGSAAFLFILSFYKNRQVAKVEQQKMDTMQYTVMEEINKLQGQINTMEIDVEITAHELGSSYKERLLLRELLDLYKRGYSMEIMAAKKQVDESEIETLLAPYMSSVDERRQAANEH
ncbi:hypothetical protein ACOI1C_12010 [Bacillus sp. DJP31]|uniref:hypothetical protein n=1 Tax=Bacillus sp. DJP31 TaxID=3409789 RepID=UPI003BB62E5A